MLGNGGGDLALVLKTCKNGSVFGAGGNIDVTGSDAKPAGGTPREPDGIIGGMPGGRCGLARAGVS